MKADSLRTTERLKIERRDWKVLIQEVASLSSYTPDFGATGGIPAALSPWDLRRLEFWTVSCHAATAPFPPLDLPGWFGTNESNLGPRRPTGPWQTTENLDRAPRSGFPMKPQSPLIPEPHATFVPRPRWPRRHVETLIHRWHPCRLQSARGRESWHHRLFARPSPGRALADPPRTHPSIMHWGLHHWPGRESQDQRPCHGWLFPAPGPIPVPATFG